MKTKIILIALFFPLLLSSQSTESLLKTKLLNDVLHYEFSNMKSVSIIDDSFKCFLIKTEIDTNGVCRKVGDYSFNFFDVNTSILQILEKPYKNNKGRSIYTIKICTDKVDTIDFFIQVETITQINFFKIVTESIVKDIPDYTFAYFKDLNIWKLIEINGEAVNKE